MIHYATKNEQIQALIALIKRGWNRQDALKLLVQINDIEFADLQEELGLIELNA